MKKLITVTAVLFLMGFLLFPLYTGDRIEAKAKPVKLVGASMLPTEHIYYRAMMKFSEFLKDHYKGPLEVDVHHSGDLGSEKDFFEFMMQGISVDIAFIAPSWIATWSKKAAFMDTPFLWRDFDHKVKALESGVFESVEKELLKKGVRILGYGGGGTRNMVLRKSVKTMDDLPKVLMRVMGSPIQAKVFNATGVQATPMAYAEVYNAIKTGVVDGLENEAAGIVTMKFYEVAPYVILTRHTLTIRPFCFSEKRLQSFPKNLQDAILKAGAEAAKWARDTEAKEDWGILQKMSSEGKAQLIEFDNTEMIKRAGPVVEAYAKELGVEDILRNLRNIK
jgi:TRAP-type C4-dicarboxylate transport system substrate-binding protein